MEAFWTEVVQFVPKEELGEFIQIFKVFKPKQVSKSMQDSIGPCARLVIRFQQKGASMALQEQLIAYARRAGWKVMSGTTPKSQKERNVQETLKKLRR